MSVACTRARVFVMAIFVILFGIIFSGAVHADNKERDGGKSIFEANVLAPIVKIDVPDHVNFGNVSPGFSSERVRIDIDNIGTTAVTVTPKLNRDDELIFKHLVFARRTTEAFKPIGDFSFSISRPNGIGKKESDYFYAKLDLSQYKNELREDMAGHRASIVFWVLPQ